MQSQNAQVNCNVSRGVDSVRGAQRVKYTNNNFKYYKTNEEKLKKLKIDNYKLLSNISFRKELLEKDYYKYINSEGKPIEIRIFSTNNNLKYLSDNNINQYYIDGTYKLIPDTDIFSAVILLLGFNFQKNLNLLCLVGCFGDEKEETYNHFYNILKNKYDFNPKFLTCDFMKSNLNSIKNIFKEDTKIITCYFHFIQILWRKANSLHLRNKNYIQTTKLLIFNLKLLPFLKFDDMLKFYKEIKRQNIFNDNLYDIFFTYLEKNWIGYEKKQKKILNILNQNIHLIFGDIVIK